MDPSDTTDPPREATPPVVVVLPRLVEAPQALLSGTEGMNLAARDIAGAGSVEFRGRSGGAGRNNLLPGGGGFGRGGGPAPDPVDPTLKLTDIGGLDSHIRSLEISVLYPILKPEALQEWGIDPPKGILFYGPPGTGKTLLAKTLAAEASKIGGKRVSFFYHKGGESFSMWFGETEQKLKALFASAKRHKPSIIFFDEIDGLAPNRSNIVSGHAYTAVVTALLGLIDSVKRGEVFIIAATNQVNSVDPAVLRPGRFDKTLEFSLPDEAGREKILQVKTSHWQRCRPSADLLKSLAKSTVGYTGADLAKLAQDAVYCGATRCEAQGLRDVDVKKEDWMKAMAEMNHSPTAVFGSSLTVFQPLPPHLHPFVGPRIIEIIAAMRSFLPSETDEMDEDSKNSLGTKTFLLHSKNPVLREFLHFVMSRGILAEKEMSNFSVYELSTNSVLASVGGGSLMRYVEKVVDQVVNSAKPSILFLPHLDLIDKMVDGDKKVHGFYSQLERVRGPRSMIFATACSEIPLASLPPELKVLFGHDDGRMNKLLLRTATTAERRAFFRQLFADVEEDSELGQAIYRKVEKAVDETKGNQPEDIFRLYDAFKSAKEVDAGDLEALDERMEHLVGEYAKNKLKFS